MYVKLKINKYKLIIYIVIINTQNLIKISYKLKKIVQNFIFECTIHLKKKKKKKSFLYNECMFLKIEKSKLNKCVFTKIFPKCFTFTFATSEPYNYIFKVMVQILFT